MMRTKQSYPRPTRGEFSLHAEFPTYARLRAPVRISLASIRLQERFGASRVHIKDKGRKNGLVSVVFEYA